MGTQEETSSTAPAASTNPNAVHNAVKIVGEGVAPGASLILDGKVVEGGAHLALGFIARRLLGLPGLIIGANSYTKSTTGKGLLGHLGSLFGSGSSGS